MTGEQQFCLDVFEIVPDRSVCYIQAPSCNNKQLIDLLEGSKYPWAKQIVLNRQNKASLKSLIESSSVVEEFNNITIEVDNKTIFEGYDGMELGQFSKGLSFPDWFHKKYIGTECCIISSNW